jgi:hypothetical protein
MSIVICELGISMAILIYKDLPITIDTMTALGSTHP